MLFFLSRNSSSKIGAAILRQDSFFLRNILKSQLSISQLGPPSLEQTGRNFPHNHSAPPPGYQRLVVVCFLSFEKMANTVQFCHSLQGQAGLPNYQQLKEDHDMTIIEAPGVPAGATVIRMHSPEVYTTPPSDHILWSLCTTLYFNVFCLGFFALVFSVKARDRKVIGDYNGAASYGSTAKCLNLIALLLNILCAVAIVVVIVLMLSNIQPH